MKDSIAIRIADFIKIYPLFSFLDAKTIEELAIRSTVQYDKEED